MTGREYLALGYAIALGLMWGYAIVLWISLRRMARRTRQPRSE